MAVPPAAQEPDSAPQRIVPVRRRYNQWAGNETLEDYALRFTARSARRWSPARVANTALGSVSFLALEAIGATITLAHGFQNAVAAIALAAVLLFASGLPISWHTARHGVDIDLLTRGAGFGYVGSTVTSLIYASFTFIFFAIEASILAAMLEACFGVPPWAGYVLCTVAVLPLVTHGITFISRFQLWTQGPWLALHLLPFLAIAAAGPGAWGAWTGHAGAGASGGGLDPLAVAAGASVVFALVAQIGEQADFLRFLPEPRTPAERRRWWLALLAGGPGWIVPGALKLLAGSLLACLALEAGLPAEAAAQPFEMYRLAFGYAVASPTLALLLAGAFVALSQMKINVTNAYAGSIAWSNFFSRLTHAHPGRVVWLVFNLGIALLLMELGVYHAIERTLTLFSGVSAAWVGALVADLVVCKPLGLSPRGVEFRRAHLPDLNPVGLGAMGLGGLLALAAQAGLLGAWGRALSPFLAFAAAFAAAPLIARATGGRHYLARAPAGAGPADAAGRLRCVVCEGAFEPEDCAACPAYGGTICSLCCSLDARCGDACKPPAARAGAQLRAWARPVLPARVRTLGRAVLASALGRYLALLPLVGLALGGVLALVHGQMAGPAAQAAAPAFRALFFVLLVIGAVATWLGVLVAESQRTAREEARRQTLLLMGEIRAHRRTDAALQKAKEAAEAANLAKSRYVVGISHELRTPLHAILGYAQLLERGGAVPEGAVQGLRVIRRSGEHMTGLIEGLLDISKIEAGRIDLYRDAVPLAEFLEQLVQIFRPQAEARGIGFVFEAGPLPPTVHTDERRLRQILINLLSNAIKFTARGEVALRVRWRSEIAEFEVSDTGPGIAPADLERIFEPFQRVDAPRAAPVPGVGLGLTITRLLTRIMGGEVTVESEPGAGSRFRVRLMLSRADRAPPPAAPRRPIRGYAGQRLSVVVADDDPVHRALMRDLLGPLGFTVLDARDGLECLDVAAGRHPDLFLLDLSMPGPAGWALARELRRRGQERAAILMVSANAGDLRPPAGEAAAHDGVLAKPVDVAALLDWIGRQLGIAWLEERAGEVPTAPAADAGGAPIPAGPRAELRRLAAMGYVRGLRERLEVVAREAPAAAAEVARLRALVTGFRLDEAVAALDAGGEAGGAPSAGGGRPRDAGA